MAILVAIVGFVGPWVAPGQAQTTSSVRMDGSTSSLSLPPLPSLGTAITIEGWINPRSHVGGACLLDLGNGAGNNNILLTSASDSETTAGRPGRPSFEVISGTTSVLNLSAPGPIPLDTWTHIAAVLGSDRSARLYINGWLVASGTATAAPQAVSRTSNLIGNSSWSKRFNGSIADVRIWTVARTEAEIVASMGVGSLAGVSSGLVAAYPFGATGQAPLNDVSGNDLTLTPSGNVLYQTTGPSSPVAAPGAHSATSAELNGQGFLTMASFPDLSATNSVTLEGWVNPRSHANWGRMVDVGNAQNHVLLVASSGTSGRPVLYVVLNGNGILNLSAPNPIPVNAWTHVAGVLNPDRTARLYVNGQLVASGTASSTAPFAASGGMSGLLGKSRVEGEALLDAALADVRVWSTSRTDAQIQSGMALGFITGPATGLVGAYPFGSTGQAALNDVSGNNRTLTPSETVRFNSAASPSLRTSSAQINGAGHLVLPTLPAMSTPLTVEGWVRPRSHASWGRVVDLGNGTANGNIILSATSATTGRPSFTILSGATGLLDLTAPNAIPLNAWTHVAAVLNSDRSALLYVNGELVATGTASSLPQSVSRTSNFIGRSNWASDALLDASVADVRVWNVARSQSEIRAGMGVGSVDGPRTGLVAAYPFGATGVAPLNDVSGNGRTLSYGSTGSVQFQVASPSSPTVAPTDSAVVAQLNGSGSHFTSSTPAISGALTVEGWVYPTSHVNYGRVVDYGNGTNNVILTTSFQTTGRPQWIVNIGSNPVLSLTAPATSVLPLNTWSHIAGVLNSDRSATLYINGLAVASGTATALASVAASGTNFIGGSRWGDSFLAGRIADVRIWSVGRTQGQVQSFMPVGSISGPASGLVAAFPFGSTGARVLSDVSGSGLLLTPVGSPYLRKEGAGLSSLLVFEGAMPALVSRGQVTLLGDSTHSGGVAIDGPAILQVGVGGTAGTLGSARVENQGSLVFDRSDTPSVGNTITGQGTLLQRGTGTLVLTGDNSYSGVTTISAGTLQVGNGGTTGTPGSGNVVNNASLVIHRSDNITLGNAISGTGNVFKRGAGTLTVTGNSSYMGVTTISEGTLQVGNGDTTGTLGSGSVVVANNASLVLNRSGSRTLWNAISGTGSVTKDGDDILTLQGLATHSGGTLVNRGTLRLVSDDSGIGVLRGQVTVASQGRLLLEGGHASGFSSGGRITGITVQGGIVESGAWGGNGWGVAFRMTGGELRSNGGVSIAAAESHFAMGGGATVTTLAHSSSALISGCIRIGHSNPNDTLVFDVADGAASPDLSVTAGIGQQSVTGAITKTGSGTMALSGNNIHSGPTVVSGGTLALTGSGSLASTRRITVGAGATFDVSGRSSTFALGASQVLANSGGTAGVRGAIQATSGTLALSVGSSTPAFTVTQGTLSVSAATALQVAVSGSAWTAGNYKLVAKSGDGSVAGVAPSDVIVSGLAQGHVATARIVDGELLLRVGVPASVTLGNLSQPYTGAAVSATATTAPAGLPVSLTYNGSTTLPSAVGSYTVVATITDAAYSGSATGTLVITKAPATVSLGNLEQAYTGSPRRVVVATVPVGLPWTATYNGSTNPPVNVGSYAVVVTLTDPNYVGGTNGVLLIRPSVPGQRAPANLRPPLVLNHQGFLVDASGTPLGSPNPRNYDLIFRIFASSVGGSPLWAERQTVLVDQGRYSTALGEGQSQGIEPWIGLDAAMMSGGGGARYLEVTARGVGVGGSDVTLPPRFQMISQPYAFLAAHARTADTLVSSNGTPILRVSGDSVGINVEQPNAGLDVGGTLTTTTFSSPGAGTVTGMMTAQAFAGLGTIPLGGIVVWSGTNVPTGWALCDGREVMGRKTPDLRARFVLGQGSGTNLTTRTVGQVGGQESQTLTLDHLAAHTHVMDPPGSNSTENGSHFHFYNSNSVADGLHAPTYGRDQSARAAGPYTGLNFVASTIHGSPHSHEFSFSSTSSQDGLGRDFSSLPPFYVLAYIMRVQ